MSKILKILGCDPSFSNWGIALAAYDVITKKVIIGKLDVTQPETSKGKQVRQNSADLERAKQLWKPMIPLMKWADAVAVEVPHGSQSSRASVSYGVCIGILASLTDMNTPMIQVSANETRKIITGKATATKEQAIQWAMAKHPEAPWPMHGGKVNASKAEHMADAIAAIYAAMETETFKTMAMLASKE